MGSNPTLSSTSRMDLLAAYCAQHGFGLSARQLDAFHAFEDDLYAANAAMNLTRVPREECPLRHFVDSLLVQEWLPTGASVLDLGAGPGLPAWPLACARPDLKVTALDSSGKMLGFLRRHPLPNLEIVEARAEEWGVREAFDVVTGRALAPLPAQLELSAPRARVGGLVVPFRTPGDVEAITSLEPTPLGLRLERVEHRTLPDSDVVRVFPLFRKVSPTPSRYPRRWALIREKPFTGGPRTP